MNTITVEQTGQGRIPAQETTQFQVTSLESDLSSGSSSSTINLVLKNADGIALANISPSISITGNGDSTTINCSTSTASGSSSCSINLSDFSDGLKTISLVSPAQVNGGQVIFYKKEVKSSIGSNASRDFSTIAVWETARGGNLVTRQMLYVSSPSGNFTAGETVTGGSSGCSGTFRPRNSTGSISRNLMELDGMAGSCTAGETLSGGTSSATVKLEKILLTTGTIERGEMYADSASYDQNLLFSGNTTDGNHYFHLTAAPGHEHRGIAGQGVVIDPSGFSHVIEIESDYTRLSQLEITGWPNNDTDSWEGVRIEGNQVLVENMIIHSEDYGASTNPNGDAIHIASALNPTLTAYIRNSIFYSISRGAINYQGADAITVFIDNLSIAKTGNTGADSEGGIHNGSATATFVITNSISVQNGASGANDYNGTLSGTSSNNISEDASAPGSNPLTGVVPSDQFINLTSGSEDLHLKTGSDAINYGIDRSFTTDIDGDTRALGSFDVGADEL